MSDPAVYAAAVATVLFGMDHRNYTGADYVALFSEARSPESVELIGDFTDAAFLDALGRRIPDGYMWQRMADSQQWATYSPERVWEPAYIAEKRRTVSSRRASEFGSHDELVAAGGAYDALWRSWHGGELNRSTEHDRRLRDHWARSATSSGDRARSRTPER